MHQRVQKIPQWGSNLSQFNPTQTITTFNIILLYSSLKMETVRTPKRLDLLPFSAWCSTTEHIAMTTNCNENFKNHWARQKFFVLVIQDTFMSGRVKNAQAVKNWRYQRITSAVPNNQLASPLVDHTSRPCKPRNETVTISPHFLPACSPLLDIQRTEDSLKLRGCLSIKPAIDFDKLFLIALPWADARTKSHTRYIKDLYFRIVLNFNRQ
jgi:hypothetical protein